MTVPIVLVASFACICVGVLLLGIAAVKEAFTPTIIRRTECGHMAVEERTRA